MAVLAHGTTLTINSINICGIRTIDGPNEEKAIVDATDHCSEGTREYVGGLKDGGTVDLELLVEAADVGQQELYTSYLQTISELAEFVITPPGDPAVTGDDFTLSFSGFVISSGWSFPFDDVATQTVSVKISGAVAHSLVTAPA